MNYFLCFSIAMQQVLENLEELPISIGAKDIDLIFLKGVMESPIVQSLAKVISANKTHNKHRILNTLYKYNSLPSRCIFSYTKNAHKVKYNYAQYSASNIYTKYVICT